MAAIYRLDEEYILSRIAIRNKIIFHIYFAWRRKMAVITVHSHLFVKDVFTILIIFFRGFRVNYERSHVEAAIVRRIMMLLFKNCELWCFLLRPEENSSWCAVGTCVGATPSCIVTYRLSYIQLHLQMTL